VPLILSGGASQATKSNSFHAGRSISIYKWAEIDKIATNHGNHHCHLFSKTLGTDQLPNLWLILFFIVLHDHFNLKSQLNLRKVDTPWHSTIAMAKKN
jgi:hypothetical protein